MASSSTSWMPPAGRYRVDVGSSLGRALKARKLNGEAPPPNPKRSNLPDKDFYSFRYAHKPPSVDPKKPGLVEFKKKDASSATTVVLEQPSTQPGESAMFRGQEASLNKLDFVLIYDEDTGTFTLEKLDACIQLTYDRNLPSIIPQRPSPTPSTSVPHVNARPQKPSLNDTTSIDQDILGLVDDDADGEVDEEIAKIIPKSTPRRRQEEEEEDDDGFPAPKRHRSPPKPKPKPEKASRPVKALPKSLGKASVSAAPPPAPAPKPVVAPPAPVPAPKATAAAAPAPLPPAPASLPPRPKPVPANKGKRPVREAAPQARAEIEELPNPRTSNTSSISNKPAKSARPVAKQQQQPAPAPAPTPSPPDLALPGSSSHTTLAPALPSSSSTSTKRAANSLPKGGRSAPSPQPQPQPQPVAVATEVPSESESDSDWDEVETADAPAAGAAGAVTAGGTGVVGGAAPAEDELTMLEEEIFGDEMGGEDDEFQKQLELEMAGLEEEEGDEEGDADADMEPVEGGGGGGGEAVDEGPISLNALAGGGGIAGFSDDEYSSSDESDDDDDE